MNKIVWNKIHNDNIIIDDKINLKVNNAINNFSKIYLSRTRFKIHLFEKFNDPLNLYTSSLEIQNINVYKSHNKIYLNR